MTQRLPRWQSLLQAVLAERRQRPFAWGENDCCLFVCDCVAAMTGHDPAADLRGYRTEREASRLVSRLGGLRAIATARLGAEVPVAQAQVGDVVLLAPPGARETLALCGGSHCLAPGEHQLEIAPMSAAVTAWRPV